MYGLTHQVSSVISKEGDLYVALCLELNIVSQGPNIDEAIKNLKEAIELYLEDEDAEYANLDFRPFITLIEVG